MGTPHLEVKGWGLHVKGRMGMYVKRKEFLCKRNGIWDFVLRGWEVSLLKYRDMQQKWVWEFNVHQNGHLM